MDRATIDDRLLEAKEKHKVMLSDVKIKQEEITKQLIAVERSIKRLKSFKAKKFWGSQVKYVINGFINNYGPNMGNNWQQEHAKYDSLEKIQARIALLEQDKQEIKAELKKAKEQVKDINKENAQYIASLRLEKQLGQRLESHHAQTQADELRQDYAKITALNAEKKDKINAYSKVLVEEKLVAAVKKTLFTFNDEKELMILSSFKAIKDVAIKHPKSFYTISELGATNFDVTLAATKRGDTLTQILSLNQRTLAYINNFQYKGKRLDTLLQERQTVLKEAKEQVREVKAFDLDSKELIKKHKGDATYRALGGKFAAEVIRRAQQARMSITPTWMQQLKTGWGKQASKREGLADSVEERGSSRRNRL